MYKLKLFSYLNKISHVCRIVYMKSFTNYSVFLRDHQRRNIHNVSFCFYSFFANISKEDNWKILKIYKNQYDNRIYFHFFFSYKNICVWVLSPHFTSEVLCAEYVEKRVESFQLCARSFATRRGIQTKDRFVSEQNNRSRMQPLVDISK